MIAIIHEGAVLALVADDATFDGDSVADGEHVISGIHPAATVRYGCRLAAEAPAAGPWLESDLEDDPDAPSLAEVQAQVKAANMRLMQAFITAKPSGAPRYDADLKLIMGDEDALYFRANASGHPLVGEVRAWMDAVQAYYYQVKGQVEATATVQEAEALRLAYADFEARFGVDESASVARDPDYSAAQIKAWRA